MLRIEDQVKKLAALTSVILMATAEALAQDNSSRPARRVVVSIPDRKLAVMEGDRVVRIFEIANSIEDPTWYTKGRTVPPGPHNPLGTRWLGLSAKGYGIHGTNVPSSIGKNASHGCIRMRNRDVEQLFKMVAVGDSVELIGERSDEIARLFAPVAAEAATGGKNREG